MNPDEQKEIDGTKPSEGGSIVIDHDEDAVQIVTPGLTITPSTPKTFNDGGLKPFSQELVNDALVDSKEGQLLDDSKSIFTDTQNSAVVSAAVNVLKPNNVQIGYINNSTAPTEYAQNSINPVASQTINSPPQLVNQVATNGVYSTNPHTVSARPMAANPYAQLGGANTMSQLPPTGNYPPLNTGLSGSNGAIPPKKGKKSKVILVIIPIILMLLSAAAYAFLIYIPNTPENIWKTGLDRTGQQMDAIVAKLDDPNTIKQYDKTMLKMQGSIERGQGKYSLNLDSKLDKINSDSSLDYSSESDNIASVKVNAQLKTNLPEDALIPNVYFKLKGISSLGLDGYLPGLADYEDKWIAIEQDFIKQYEDTLRGNISAQSTESGQYTWTNEEVVSLIKDFNSVNQEYIFTSDAQKAVLELGAFVGTEDSEGIKANHYQAKLNKVNAKLYCDAVIDKLLANNTAKKLFGLTDEETTKQYAKNKKNDCKKSVDEIKDDERLDIWFDKKYKLFHKIRMTDDAESNNEAQISEISQGADYNECLVNNNGIEENCTYIKPPDYDTETNLEQTITELGQVYKGGDELMLFVSSKDLSNEARIDVSINTKELSVSGKLYYKLGQSEGKTVAIITFNTEPYSGEIDSQKPNESIPIKQVIEDLTKLSQDYGVY